ncbi:hypothetical protein ENBRE01_3307 [Enteropsectra breve]|nr:hypothetical protein ENBRE01_3307 [Enteropsectra breve]
MEGEKRKPVIIGKFAYPRCLKNQDISCFSYYANKKVRMISEIFRRELILWDLKLRQINRKILLVVENVSSHPDVSDSLSHIKIIFLPPNITSKLQPLDAGIIRSFKSIYRKSFVLAMIQAYDSNGEFKFSVLDAIKIIYLS